MDKIKEELTRLFDEMLPQARNFKKKTYEDIFLNCHRKYKDTVEDITNLCAESKGEDREKLMREVASVIPDHASECAGKLTKHQRDISSIDYNMTMVVYVLPLITYTHNPYCEQVADYMVERWNDLKITDMSIGKSTYEDIAGGFRKKLCYITTAVCESRNLADDCRELKLFRYYRDGYLMQTEEGRELVEEYYDIAPVLVQIIDMHSDKDAIYEEIYQDYLKPCALDIEAGRNEQCRERYTKMVRSLQQKYLS